MNTVPKEPALPSLVSIALCTYNGSRYLREQLESLLTQTYSNIEVVAIDDCSTDDTLAILNEFCLRDSRLRVFVNSTNLGFMRNFERAMSECRGVFIAPCDQDDIWHSNKIELLMNHIGSGSLVYCDSEFVDRKGSAIGLCISDLFPMVSTNDPALFALGNSVSGHAMLFRQSLLKRALPFPEGFFHDWWLAAVAAASRGVIYCPLVLVKYRQHRRNLTDLMDSARERDKRPPAGYKIRELREVGKRLELLAQLSCGQQTFIAKWYDLWKARERQWFSFRLGWLMVRHRQRLCMLQCWRIPRSHFLRRAVRYVLGLRLKRLTNAYAYTIPLAEHFESSRSADFHSNTSSVPD